MFRVNLSWKPSAVQDFHNWNISFWSLGNTKNLQGNCSHLKCQAQSWWRVLKFFSFHQTGFKHKLLLFWLLTLYLWSGIFVVM